MNIFIAIIISIIIIIAIIIGIIIGSSSITSIITMIIIAIIIGISSITNIIAVCVYIYIYIAGDSLGCSGMWCLRMFSSKVIVDRPSKAEGVGTSHLKLIWVRALKLVV